MRIQPLLVLASAALCACTGQSAVSQGRAPQAAPAYLSLRIPAASAMESIAIGVGGGAPALFAVGAGRPGCVAGDETTTCSLALSAPLGPNVAFDVRTYATPNGTGPALAATNIFIPVTVAGPNTLALNVERRI